MSEPKPVYFVRDKNPSPYAEVRCASCNRLLFKLKGTASIEIVCPRCKIVNKISLVVTATDKN